jgi:hypothetical protein
MFDSSLLVKATFDFPTNKTAIKTIKITAIAVTRLAFFIIVPSHHILWCLKLLILFMEQVSEKRSKSGTLKSLSVCFSVFAKLREGFAFAFSAACDCLHNYPATQTKR